MARLLIAYTHSVEQISASPLSYSPAMDRIWLAPLAPGELKSKKKSMTATTHTTRRTFVERGHAAVTDNPLDPGMTEFPPK
jgi:hypothetical protein